MYHIKKDKRMITSANLIYEGLVELLNEKSFDVITITELAKISGVGRATVHRLFDTKEDVLYYQFDSIFETISINAEELAVKKNDLYDLNLMKGFFDFWLLHQEFLAVLIKCGLYSMLSERIRLGFKTKLVQLQNTLQFDDRLWDYFMNTRSAVLCECLFLVITKYKHDTSEDIAQVIAMVFGNIK